MGAPQTASLAMAIFGGKTKMNVIASLFLDSEKSFYMSELARRVGVSSSMMTKELKTLADAGLVLSEPNGNRINYRANPDCPIFAELKSIAEKIVSSGVVRVIHDALQGIHGIRQAFIFGSIAKGTDHAGSDVDLAIVEEDVLNRMDVYERIAEAEQRLQREIQLQYYSVNDPRIEADAVIRSIFQGPKIMVINNGD